MTYDEFLNFLDQFEEIKSFAGRQKFADQHLQRIGSGSGRIVYDIDGEKVFKIAKNAKGVAQNGAESDAGRYQDTHNIVAKIFEFDNNGSWIIAEKGKKVTDRRIRELTGIPSLDKLHSFLKIVVHDQKPGRNIFSHYLTDEEKEFFWENEFASDLADFAVNYGQEVGNMGRPSTYGEVLRDGQPTIVLTDYGLSDEVYSTHYDRSRKQKYQVYEIYGVQHGNTDHLSDIGNVSSEVRQGMWALVPHSIGDSGDNINEEFVSFVVDRELYPKQPTTKLPILSEIFHHCINNLREILNKVDDKKKFYKNLLKLQEYLIEEKYYDWDELKYEEYSINEEKNREIPKVQPYTLDNKEYAIALANAAAEKLNLGNLKYLAGGGFGFAFEVNDDIIFKLTSDISEADAAVKLFRVEPQRIAKIYNIYKIFDTEKNLSFFGIVQENIQNKPIDKFRTYQDTIDKIKPSGMDFVDFILYSKKVNKIGYDEVINSAKAILTDNPDVNVSTDLRQETLNFMIGLVDIRKELLELGIKSDDYSEIKNLGYKDGVLKFFDVGGYISTEPDIDDSNIITIPESTEISEEYDKNKALSIANQITSKLKLEKPKPISGGNFGVAFDIGNDKVLKITKDNSEAAENLMLIGKPLKYIAQPYNVYEIQSKKNESTPKTWAIILEKLDTNPNIKRQYDRLEFAFNKILGVGIPDVIEHYLGEWDNSKVNKNKINSYLKKNPQDAKFFGGLLKIAEETKSYGIASMDYLNSSNLGYKKNGVLGFFDVGFGDGFLQPKNLEKIEVDEDGSSRFSTDGEMGQDGFPPYNNNDTSPSIQNNLNANSNLYTEDLEYSKVSDATEDEYIMDERKKAWIPGSVAVEVKKKCRLGGLGTTSVACNQGDINNLTFKKLNEIGEANVDVYPLEINRSDELVKIYRFTTEDNDNYFLEFVKANEDDNMWRMDFGLLNPNNPSQTFTNVVNKGRIYRVMATILKVLRGFFINTNPDTLVIEPTKTKSKEDNRRFSLYLQYIKKHLPNEYEYTVDGKEIIINRKKKVLTTPNSNNQLQENLDYYELNRGVFKDEPIHVSDFPLKDLTVSKRGMFGAMQNIKQGHPSQTNEPVLVFYNISNKTFLVEDGYHRVAQAYLNKEKTIPVNIYSDMWSDYVANVSPDNQFKLNEVSTGEKYYRAVEKNLGKTVEFEPEGYYEAIDDYGDPIYKFNTFWVSDKPEVAASKSVGGAVMGLYSMFMQHGKKPEIFYIYEINEKPDVDISHWEIDDFAYLQEVRYRRPVKGKYKGKVLITDDIIKRLRAFYEIAGLDAYDEPDEEYMEIVKNTDYDKFLNNIKNTITEKKDLTKSQILTLNQLPFKNDVQERGGKIFTVGGAVRDEFLGKESKDLDVLITGIPMDELEQILSNYGRVDAVGKSFGILKFKPKGGEEIDIAIPRTEKPSGEGGHKGFDVTSDHTLSIEKDLERRDFTINAIAKDVDGNIVDPFGGQEDLKNKIIRVVNPEAFSDDPLRMLRAVQFASRFGFTIEPQTMEMIKNNANRIKEIPTERILTEFGKIVFKGNKRMGVQLLKDTGLFQQIFGFDIKQSTIDRSPFEDVKTMGEFIFLITRLLSNPAEHYKNNLKGDIDTYKEIKALDMAFENTETINPIQARLIAHNMFVTSPQSLQSETLPAVIKNAAQELLTGKYPKTVNELGVNGNDLIKLGLQGREIGDMQKSLLLKIYSNKVRNSREELLNLASQ